MLNTLEKIFETNSIRTGNGDETIALHSNTSMEQGIFLQQIFDKVKPKQSLEVGFAYGVSAMFILEKHRENNAADAAHIVIEPDSYWGNTALYNIQQEGLDKYLDIKRDYSDRILPSLYFENHRIQYAYIDTTKRFDTVFQDFYFIDKILDTGGVVILDDCGGTWPGVQRVARYISTLPNYTIEAAHHKIVSGLKKRVLRSVAVFLLNLIPFKNKLYPTIGFSTDEKLGLNYRCIAFRKTNEDNRNWDFDRSF